MQLYIIIKIAIQGCLHGQLQKVYQKLTHLQKKLNIQIDALLIAGDFQAIRQQSDLQYLHCPEKYKQIGSFQKYFIQKLNPPFITIFIGGNHEAVNSSRQSYFGGWIANKIYYLGQAGSIYIKKGNQKIRISGLSGIYNQKDFQYLLKYQKVPLKRGQKISAYHTKQLDIFRMQLLGRLQIIKNQKYQNLNQNNKYQQNFDIFLSHDWPRNICLYGNTQQLLKYKPFLKNQIQTNTFGSPPLERLLKLLKPQYWFSAHMHVKFGALFHHNENYYTHFLALDKCIDSRSCIQVIRFQSKLKEVVEEQKQPKEKTNQIELFYDRNWIKVIKETGKFQKQGLLYYKYDENSNLKLEKSEIMNKILQRYQKQLKNQKEVEQQQIKIKFWDELQSKSQLDQTKLFLQLCEVSLQQFQGIIFEQKENSLLDKKQYLLKQQNQNKKNNEIRSKIQDEIELQL